MSVGTWYQNKAEQCARLAAGAADPETRAKFEHEGRLWRGIAHDLEKQAQAAAKSR